MRPMISRGGRAVPGFAVAAPFGLSDTASDLGVSTDASGVHWDAEHAAAQLPAGSGAIVTGGAAALQGGGNAAAAWTAMQGYAAALALLAGFPESLAVAGVVAALNALPQAGPGPGCCAQQNCPPDYWQWEKWYGAYAPGAVGSFAYFANTTLRALYDKTANCARMASANEIGVVLAGGLAQVVAAWNATHAPPSVDVVIPHTNGGRSGGFSSGVPADGSPLAVAVNAVAVAAKAPADVTFRFSVNGGPAHTATPLNPQLIAPAHTATPLNPQLIAPAPSSTSTGKKLAIGAAVVGVAVLAVAASKGVSLRRIFR